MRDRRFSARVPRQLDGKLDHLLAINAVRIALAVTLPAAGGEIAWWRSDWELCGRGQARVVPDALFSVRWPGLGEQAFGLEVDRGTRSPRRFLEKVLRYHSLAYRSAALHGVDDCTILVVGNDSRSLERYRAAVAHVRLTTVMWFTTLHGLEQSGAMGAIWRPAAVESRHSLRDLSGLPYRKEGPGAETHGPSQR